MGVGKTTVARAVARRLGRPFVDLDEAVEHREGCSIADLFAVGDEARFRRAEAETLAEVLENDGSVIALGGGTLHAPPNRALLESSAEVVVLWASFEEIRGRVQRDATVRPLWNDAETLWGLRQAVYRSTGTMVDVSGLGVEEATAAVVEVLGCA